MKNQMQALSQIEMQANLALSREEQTGFPLIWWMNPDT